MKINYKRLLWDIFILLYSALFFYNCLSPYENWFFSYLYTMFLVIWLCKEYYQKNLFFQPTYIPNEAHNYLLRGLFALFFYSSFVFGIITIVWWHRYKILNSPVLPIIGIILLCYGIYLREKNFRMVEKDRQTVLKFYISIGFIIFSMAFGYDSYFVLLYALLIGLPLIILQIQYYTKKIEVKIGFVKREEK
ncbi:MAG: hypothetical protein ABIL18_03650 [candidate division WOR-3 bacterium]